MIYFQETVYKPITHITRLLVIDTKELRIRLNQTPLKKTQLNLK